MNIIEKKCDPSTGFACVREDASGSWIEFVSLEGRVLRWDSRDASGACLGEGSWL